jgi:hypothetical protein
VNPAAKLAAFALVLTGALGAGAALGSAVGPIDVGGDPRPEHDDQHPSEPTATTAPHDGHDAP